MGHSNTTVGVETAAKLEQLWPSILACVASGERYSVILERIGISYESMRAWRSQSPERRQQWDEARRESAAALLERMLDMVYNLGALDPARARVQLDSLKFLVEKLDPDRYGQRTRVDVRHIDMSETLRLAAERASAWRLLRMPTVPVQAIVMSASGVERKVIADLM